MSKKIDLVIDGLYISDIWTAWDLELLKKYVFNSIENYSCFDCNRKPSKISKSIIKQDLVYFVVPIVDSPSVEIYPYFKESIEFIDKGRKNGNVLVHWC